MGKSRHAPLHFLNLCNNPEKELSVRWLHPLPKNEFDSERRNILRQMWKIPVSLALGLVRKMRVLSSGENTEVHHFVLVTTDQDHNSSLRYQSLFSKTISVRSCGITVSIRSDVLSCFVDLPQLLSLNTQPTDNTWGISLLSVNAPQLRGNTVLSPQYHHRRCWV